MSAHMGSQDRTTPLGPSSVLALTGIGRVRQGRRLSHTGMSTFAKATFNAATYSASRPTYPPKLFEHIFEFHRSGSGLHRPRYDRAVDIGCGTGQATSHLNGMFANVVCVDPSAGMLQKAREYLLKPSSPTSVHLSQSSVATSPPSSSPSDATANVQKNAVIKTEFGFVQGYAEDLHSAVPDNGSVDLLIAAQACHWFDWDKVWPETRRVLRKGGVAAFWVYGEIRLSNFPNTSPLITDYFQGTDRDSTTSVGAYFQRPGRTILERSLVDVPSPATVLGPAAGLTDFHRVYFSDDESIIPAIPSDGAHAIYPTLLHVPWRWIDLLGYLRTASAFHSFQERFPADRVRPEDTRFLESDLADLRKTGEALDPGSVRGGDVSIRFWKNLRESVQREIEERGPSEVDTGVGLFDKVGMEFPLALLLVRRT